MSSTRQPNEFKGHAALQAAPRVAKGRKIEAILGRRISIAGARLLDIGTGAGIMAKFFAECGAKVVAVDREKNVGPDFALPFELTPDARLPFEPESFDIAISNHVIEHVGERNDQIRHLEEIRRVLAPSGILYIAVPNRWTLIEPHYALPLLSWLPLPVASAFVRIARKGNWYDCRPFSRWELGRFLRRASFSFEDVTMEVLEHFIRHEMSDSIPRRLMSCLPKWVFKLALPIIPTNVFLARKD